MVYEQTFSFSEIVLRTQRYFGLCTSVFNGVCNLLYILVTFSPENPECGLVR